FREVETDPKPFVVSRRARVGLRERVEDLIADDVGDAGAAVGNDEIDLVPARAGGDPHGLAAGGEGERVLDHRAERANREVRVRPDATAQDRRVRWKAEPRAGLGELS